MTSRLISKTLYIVKPVFLITLFGFISSSFANTPASNIPAKYSQTCGVCHETGNLNAPKTGDKQAWQKLIAKKGLDGLVKSTKQGMPQMPAKGLCGDCSDGEFLALIEYMAK